MTSTDATGNISRGTFILRTRDLFLITDLVPEVSVSLNEVTNISPAKMCSAKFSTSPRSPSRMPITR